VGERSVAYKVLTAAEMALLQRERSFVGAPVDLADGYVHLSTSEQLTETVNRHFAGQADLYVVAVDVDRLGEDLRWEVSRGGALFPHLYAPLRLDTVLASGPLVRDAAGTVLPPLP
jgi:uncharacterized protein (DUF952 family)